MKLKSIFICVSLLFTFAVKAQIPVTDGGSIAQAILSFKQLELQLQQMKDTYSSLNGLRDISGLFNNQSLTRSLPMDYQQYINTLKGAQSGSVVGGLSGTMSDIVNRQSNCAQLYTDPQQLAACRAAAMPKAGTQATAQSAYDAADREMQDLQNKLIAIQNNPDAKGVADIQASIQLQQLKQHYEMTKLMAFQMAEQAKTQIEQKNQQQVMKKSEQDFSSGVYLRVPAFK